MGQKLGPMNITGTNTHCGHARNVSWTMQVQLKIYCGQHLVHCGQHRNVLHLSFHLHCSFGHCIAAWTWMIAVCSRIWWLEGIIAAWVCRLRSTFPTLRPLLGFELWRTTLRPTLWHCGHARNVVQGWNSSKWIGLTLRPWRWHCGCDRNVSPPI